MKKYVKYGVMALVAFVFIGTFVFLYQMKFLLNRKYQAS